ncbi:hypothetical protein PtA15_4A385 [Puccinia triticina]|uniref:Uncharacterized protein n=1 Tax=Puccinia triticina TaxID=208348 RepID=A0ABY7CFS0_9BASI|nr:uncharacterized protein PtA15_4A385 [Puccinia triticina]WAQ83935.1 hypothetical protein PtA15_4A385 [Puccinia triticina]WAR54781.1 hypothetical protein PtB15_4B399 [Puccinia triticina]
MAFLGLSLVTWQTLLIIGLPFICGSLSRIRAILLFLRHPFKKSQAPTPNPGSPPKKKPEVLPPRRYLRPHTFFLGLLLLAHSVRFWSTNPRKINPFRQTNLLLNVPSTTLVSSLERYYRAKGIEETPYEQARLVRRLNTLDARLVYSTVGPEAFLHCSWCRTPSSKSNGSDHLYFTLSRLGLQYATLLLAIGIMTTGASRLGMKRRVWRTRLAILSMFYFAFEAATLSLLVYVPSLLTAMDNSRMTWDTLFPLRAAFFPLILIASWWGVISESPKEPLSPIAKTGLGLATVAAELDGLVNRLRLTALQRTALMKDGSYRAQINQFWENVESQASLASSTPSIQSMKDSMGLSSSENMNHQSRDQLRSWIDNVFPEPTFTSPTPSP